MSVTVVVSPITVNKALIAFMSSILPNPPLCAQEAEIHCVWAKDLEFTHFSSEEELLTLKTKGEVRFWKWFWAFSVRTALAVVKVEQCCETRQ